MLLPTLNQAREKARRISCANNLKQMGLALKQYAMDFNSYFPNANITLAAATSNLGLLVTEEYMTDYKMFACPSTTTNGEELESKDLGTGVCTGKLVYTSSSTAAGNCDYAYSVGMMEGDSDMYGRSDSALASDIAQSSFYTTITPNHSDFGNILYHDGHVSGFTGSSWFSKENAGVSVAPEANYLYPNTTSIYK